MQFGIISCLFRQTNVIWVLYAFGISKLMDLRFQRALPGQAPPRKLHDPPALVASPGGSLLLTLGYGHRNQL